MSTQAALVTTPSQRPPLGQSLLDDIWISLLDLALMISKCVKGDLTTESVRLGHTVRDRVAPGLRLQFFNRQQQELRSTPVLQTPGRAPYPEYRRRDNTLRRRFYPRAQDLSLP